MSYVKFLFSFECNNYIYNCCLVLNIITRAFFYSFIYIEVFQNFMSSHTPNLVKNIHTISFLKI